MVNGLSQAAENAKSHGNRLCRGAALPSNPRARWVTQGRQRPLPYNPSPKPFFLTGISSRRSAFSAAWAARSLNVDPTRLPDYCGLGVARPHTRTRARWAWLGAAGRASGSSRAADAARGCVQHGRRAAPRREGACRACSKRLRPRARAARAAAWTTRDPVAASRGRDVPRRASDPHPTPPPGPRAVARAARRCKPPRAQLTARARWRGL